MNPSSAPANNETVAYGQLLALSRKLKRSDQVDLVRALAGQVGMIAVFPGQLAGQSQSAVASSSKGGKKEKKGPAKQEPSNPLSGSPEKKEFDAAKKAVSKKTKETGQKLGDSDPLVLALSSAKDKYFRSLSKAKDNEAPAMPEQENREPAKAGPSSPPKGGKAGSAAKPPTHYLKLDSKGVPTQFWDGSAWQKPSAAQIAAWK
jgi:hypothetical protein